AVRVVAAEVVAAARRGAALPGGAQADPDADVRVGAGRDGNRGGAAVQLQAASGPCGGELEDAAVRAAGQRASGRLVDERSSDRVRLVVRDRKRNVGSRDLLLL